MQVLQNIAAIAKGMSITFREMFQPTIVENYPDGPGPLKGAMFQERYRGVHVLQRDENGLEKCVACFLCAASCPSNFIYIEAADNAWKPVLPTPLPTDTASRSPLLTPATWSTAKSRCWPPCQHIWEPTPYSIETKSPL